MMSCVDIQIPFGKPTMTLCCLPVRSSSFFATSLLFTSITSFLSLIEFVSVTRSLNVASIASSRILYSYGS